MNMFKIVTNKVSMINVRLKPEDHEDFKAACDIRGLSMSSTLHQYIRKIIYEEQERDMPRFLRTKKRLAEEQKLKEKTETTKTEKDTSKPTIIGLSPHIGADDRPEQVEIKPSEDADKKGKLKKEARK